MKKHLLTTVLLFSFLAAFAQSSYDTGFKAGYKEGYCYLDFGCIPPIPPITPIPYIGESNDSYQDGYNRGFKLGLEKKSADKAGQNNRYSGSNSGSYGNNNPPSTPQLYSGPDYNLLLQLLEARQAQLEREEALAKERAKAKMQQTRSFYSSYGNYPATIKNGWHVVVAMDNYEFCQERKVYVENNKIIKYFIDDWIEKTVSLSTEVKNAKSVVRLRQDDGSDGDFLDIYFIDFMTNPSKYVSPALKPGKVSFWTDWKKSGSLKLYFEGMYVGTFESYFKEGAPVCGQNGTLTVTFKPGVYNYKAESEGTWGTTNWSGKVTITEGGCSLMGLTKK